MVKERNRKHAEKVIAYGEIHLHITEAVDAIRARWPDYTEDQIVERLGYTARRIMENRRNGVAVVMSRTDLKD